jgi:hypothetical protein
MTELITLEGIAQEKGKKVTGYKFPDNLDDLKFPFKLLFHPNYATNLDEQIQKDNKITTKQLLNVLPTDVIFVKRNGNKLITKEGYILSYVDKKSTLISPEKVSLNTISNTNNVIEKSPTSNTISNIKSNNTLEQDVNNSILGKTARKIQIGFSVVGWGVFGILAYKFWNKSMTWKVMLSVFGAYNLYSTYKIFSKPALKVSGGSNSNTGIKTETGKTTGTTTSPSNTNLTNAQKIDLIVKNMSSVKGAESSSEDEKNTRAFLTLRKPVELDRWVVISKAMNDSEINTATNQQQAFALLQSKYGLRQEDIEKDMQVLMSFLMGAVDSAINNTAFSNFENSLDLDL